MDAAQKIQAAPDTLAALGAAGGEDAGLHAFPAIFTLLGDTQGTTPRSFLYRIATLPLRERPLLITCVDTPAPHIRVLWGVQYVTPSFAKSTQEDGKVLAFTRDFCLGILPTGSSPQPWKSSKTGSRCEMSRPRPFWISTSP